MLCWSHGLLIKSTTLEVPSILVPPSIAFQSESSQATLKYLARTHLCRQVYVVKLLESFPEASYLPSSLIFKTCSWATAETLQHVGLSDVLTDPPE